MKSKTLVLMLCLVVFAAHADDKVIYGLDDRLDVYEVTDAEIRNLARSTCGLFDARDVTDNGDGTFTIDTFPYGGEFPVCPQEPYATQPTAAFCTGFRAGPDIIVTAGHCFARGDESAVLFIFGFEMQDAITPVTTIPASQVYRGVEVLGWALSNNHDYSVIRVDRTIDAPGASILPVRREGVVAVGTAVGVIGHPAGLPLKVAFGATTAVRESSSPGYFIANLDTYGGNSGSPVFNQETLEVEGILVWGDPDFDFDSERQCIFSRVNTDNGGGGEGVSKATDFVRAIDGTGGEGEGEGEEGDTFENLLKSLLIFTCGPGVTGSSPPGGDIAVIAGVTVLLFLVSRGRRRKQTA